VQNPKDIQNTTERAEVVIPSPDAELNNESSEILRSPGSNVVESSETVVSTNLQGRKRAGCVIPDGKLKKVYNGDHRKSARMFDVTILDHLGWTVVTEKGRDDHNQLEWNFSYAQILPTLDLVVWSMGQVMDLVRLIKDGVVANTVRG